MKTVVECRMGGIYLLIAFFLAFQKVVSKNGVFPVNGYGGA